MSAVENQEIFSEEESGSVAEEVAFRGKPGASKGGMTPEIPEAVDDFVRNVLRRAGLGRTLSRFDGDWYGCVGTAAIPDALTHRRLLRGQLETVRRRTDLRRQEAQAAGESLVRMQRERDFHRLQYRRVAEDRDRLVEDFKRLEKHMRSLEPALRQLDVRYRAAVKDKTATLLALQKERVQNTTEALGDPETPRAKAERDTREGRHPEDSHSARVYCEGPLGNLRLSCSIRAHGLPIGFIDLHPRRRVLASASDDRSWRLWTLPADGEKVGQMILTGEGHSDWLSGCSFHPGGEKLATTSGDSTVRLWDLSRGCCVLKLSGHSQTSWGCSFHSCGHLLASCSSDRTAKLWDLNSRRCRLTLRRHTASVNSVCFLPDSDLLLTSSADKTLAMWDARLGICTATFRGHQHPCNHTACSLAGNIVASCDSGGVINLWDIRNPRMATASVDGGPLAANQVAFSLSGKTLAVAGSDSLVRVMEVDSCAVSFLSGHSDGVQSVTFDHKGLMLMSAGSDGVINVWS